MIVAFVRVGVGSAVAVAVGLALSCTAATAAVCAGDCDGDGRVMVAELVRGVGRALGDDVECSGFEAREAPITELVRAVGNALAGCGPLGPYTGRPPALSFAGMVRESAKVLDDVSAVAASADGAHLYAANGDGTVVIFVRAPDGRLSFAKAVRGGPSGVRSMRLSPDGAHLYVAGAGDADEGQRRLAVFARDPSDGGLHRVQALQGGSEGLSRHGALSALAISPDGRSVYGADADYFTGEGALLVLARDPATGRLALVDRIATASLGLSDLDAIAVSSDASRIYAGGRRDDPERHRGRLFAFSRDAATGRLTVQQQLDEPAHPFALIGALAALADGGLLVAGETVGPDDLLTGSLVRFARSAAGLVAGETVPDDRDAYTPALAVSGDGTRAYAIHSNALSSFALDAEAPRLLAVAREGEQGVAGLSSSSDVAVSPDGAFVYAAGQVDNAVTAFAHTDTGIAFLDVQRGSLGGIEGIAGVRALAISAAGETLYATGNEDTLAGFEIDQGGLTQLDVLRSGEGGVPPLNGINNGNIAVSPDGTNVYATLLDGEGVLTLSRNLATGRLGFAGLFDDIEQNGPSAEEFPFGLAVSPDGADVYVTGSDDVDGRGIIVDFHRASHGGALTWAGGLREAGGTIVASPDGANLYAISGDLFAVARDRSTGHITLLASYPRPAGSTALAVSPNGRHLYVADRSGSLIGVYARDGSDGHLEHLGDDDAQIGLITALAVSPDGNAVYAASLDGSLTVLGRQRDSGRLRWNERHRDGSGADGLAGAAAVVASPDGEWAYVAGSADSAIAIFHVDGSPTLRDGAACEYDEDCASGVCDFLLGESGEGGPAGPIYAQVCCQRRCALEEACDTSGICQPRFPVRYN